MCDSLLAQFKLSPRHPPQMLVGCSPIPYSLQLFLACKARLPPKFPSNMATPMRCLCFTFSLCQPPNRMGMVLKEKVFRAADSYVWFPLSEISIVPASSSTTVARIWREFLWDPDCTCYTDLHTNWVWWKSWQQLWRMTRGRLKFR